MKRLSGAALSLLLASCAAEIESNTAHSREALRNEDGEPTPSKGCASVQRDLGGYWNVKVDGERRWFTVRLPRGYHRYARRPTPLVLNFHGYRNFPLFQRVFSDMDDKADSAGFIVVYPKGTGSPLSFNGSGCCGEAQAEDVDDVAFTEAMLDKLEQELCIDTRRVYATGFSNGAFMAQRLACELSERFGALAAVAGLIDPRECAPTRSISVLQFHGTSDETVPFAGSAEGRYLSAPDAFAFWAAQNACVGTPVTSYDRGDAYCERYTDCADDAEVGFCMIDGGGHTWPGGLDNFLVEAAAGKVSDSISANDVIWSFFERHPLPVTR